MVLLIFEKNQHLRLIGPPSHVALSQRFQNAEKDSIYGKIYKNNMNGLKSFFKSTENGLEHLVKGDKIAFIGDGEFVKAHKNHQCEV